MTTRRARLVLVLVVLGVVGVGVAAWEPLYWWVGTKRVLYEDDGSGGALWPLEDSDGDSNIVEVAETLGAIGKSVVEAAAQVHGEALLHGETGGEEGPAGHKLEALDDLAGDGKLGIHGVRGPPQALEIIQKPFGMNGQYGLSRGGRGGGEVVLFGVALLA